MMSVPLAESRNRILLYDRMLESMNAGELVLRWLELPKMDFQPDLYFALKIM